MSKADLIRFRAESILKQKLQAVAEKKYPRDDPRRVLSRYLRDIAWAAIESAGILVEEEQGKYGAATSPADELVDNLKHQSESAPHTVAKKSFRSPKRRKNGGANLDRETQK